MRITDSSRKGEVFIDSGDRRDVGVGTTDTDDTSGVASIGPPSTDQFDGPHDGDVGKEEVRTQGIGASVSRAADPADETRSLGACA